MKKYLSLLLFLLTPAFLFAQVEEKKDFDYELYQKNYEDFMERYKSTEEEQYYHRDEDEERFFVPFKPMSIEEVKNYKNKFFKYKEINDFTPYNNNQKWTLYEDLVLENSLYGRDEPHGYIGKIDKYKTLKYERKDDVEAMVYWESDFQQGLGVWIAYSTDKGKTWTYYYTGIIQEKPLYVKWYSKYPLIDPNGDLQIEACLMRKTNDFGLYGYDLYELVQDGLLLTFDLETLAKDSDSDGLTDIMETRFHTDLNNPDTDGDGIPDNMDMNPRFNLPRTEKTQIYEAVLNSDKRATHFWNEDECEIIPFSETSAPHYAIDTTRMILIVTDEPDLLACQPTTDRVIFLKNEEFGKTKDKFMDENSMSFSPLFKVDKVEDAYVFSVSGRFWGTGYVAEKKKDGWLIRVTYRFIE